MTEELKTTAWNCLPKEFKEEVKALYAKARNIYAIYTSATCINNTESKAIDIWNGKMQVLRELFGEHNLTSDTEGEDMLIISRKAAEEFYDKYFGKKMCEVNRSILREDFTTLFGGKCRVGEDDVIETKPKFKVGDKVKILSDGRTGTITSIKESPAPYFVIWDKPQGIAGGYLAESNIELYVEEKKFLVGDKVIISDDPRIGRNFRGRIGTVVFICSSDKRIVDVGNGVVPDTFHISHLTPYTEQKYKVGDKIRVTNIVPEKYVGSVGVVKSFSKGFYNIELLDGGVMSREEDLEPYGNDLLSENEENENNDHIVGNEHKLRNERYNTDGETYLLDPRIQVAAAAMQGMLSNPNIVMSCGDLDDNQEDITKHAVEYSDDLLKKFGIIIIKKTEK